MEDPLISSTVPFLRAQKGFEGTSAFYCWGVTARIGGRHEKCWIVADAEQKTFGVRLIAEKPENLNPAGAVVAQMRKHARAPTIGRIMRAEDSGDIWIELYTESSDQPSFYVQIAQGLPPELRLISHDKTVHVRKSSQGSFTKKRPFEGTLPPKHLTGEQKFTILNHALINNLFASAPTSESEEGKSESEPTTEQGLALPDYQREARDRIARRLKTLRKTLTKSKTPEQIIQEQALAQKRAELAQAWIHTAKEGSFELDLSFLPETPSELQRIPLDPECSVGANLERLFTTAKKLKKAAQVTERMYAATVRDEQSLADDLARLRSRPLDLRAVQDILLRHKLADKKPASSKADVQEHTPWRTFTYFDGTKPIRFMIGKSAADNDELCKKAKGNDFWLHAVGVTGSHVIIPAREAGPTPPQDLIRTAGILALHFSKFRDNLRGEVYLSKRQFIRKQKGMPPGLWTVDKADSFFISYDAAELQNALDLQKSSGAKES